jgi:hypothetical protein
MPDSYKPAHGHGRDRRSYHQMKQSEFKAASKFIEEQQKRRERREAEMRTRELEATPVQQRDRSP